jgi:hypothetical protein
MPNASVPEGAQAMQFQWRRQAERESFSGSSRSLIFSLVPGPTLPRYSVMVCGFRVKWVSVAQGAVPCQQHWHQVHAIMGLFWRVR